MASKQEGCKATKAGKRATQPEERPGFSRVLQLAEQKAFSILLESLIGWPDTLAMQLLR